jgi:hypothetical protein
VAIGKESLHEITNNAVRVVNSATSKNLATKSKMFPHRNIHKFTWMSPDGRTHNQTNDIQAFLTSNHSGQQIVIPPTTWWWQKLGRDQQLINKDCTDFI